MPMEFYDLLKKSGFSETLLILGTFEKNEAEHTIFLQKITSTKESNYNAYRRVRKLLLDHGLIKFKLNESKIKVIYLTEKGKYLLSLLQMINVILKSES